MKLEEDCVGGAARQPPFLTSHPGTMIRNPSGGVEDVQEMADAGMKWVALNVFDFPEPSQWATVRARAEAAGVVVMPKSRVGHPALGDTKAMALARLIHLVDVADAWNPDSPYAVLNVETEIKPPELGGIITPEEVAAVVGDRPFAVSTEALLYAMDWGPLTRFPMFLRIYPTDNRWLNDPAFWTGQYA